MEKEYLTKEKFKELQDELEYLTTVRRSEIAKELDSTGALGDLRENAEYQQAREDQASLEGRIAQIENILQGAEVVKAGNKDIVSVGSQVSVCKKGHKDCIDYKIVGAEEADTAAGKISSNSPLGRAMLGKKKGDIVEFEAPKGKMQYKIVTIK